MQVAQIMAGYTLGEAEQFRRAMTHKRSYEAMERLCDDLVAADAGARPHARRWPRRSARWSSGLPGTASRAPTPTRSPTWRWSRPP